MKFIPDKTTVIHKKYGKGVYKRHDGQYIVVEFSSGELTLSLDIIKNGIMTVQNLDDVQASDDVQSFDDIQNAYENQDLIGTWHVLPTQGQRKSIHTKAFISADGFFEIDDTDNIIGGNRIWEIDREHDKLSFNSSFCIMSENVQVSRIRATYDLIVMGDMQVEEEIEVKGNLTVYGKLVAKSIYAGKEFTCNNRVVAERIEAGANILVKELKCDEIICDGNIIAENDIDAKKIKTKNAILSGGGIYSDNIASQNTVAVDLVECDGECNGNIIDLSVSTAPIEREIVKSGNELRDLDYQINKEIAKSIQEHYGLSHKDMLSYLQRVAKLEVSKLCDINRAYQYLVEIIELNSIENLRHYIILQYCKNVLMLELLNNPIIRKGYEKLDVIATSDIETMEFKAKNLEDFVFCLKIVNEQTYMFDNMKDEILDKIFQSIGIKYNTVKRFLYNN